MKKFKFSWVAVTMLALTPAISSCSSDDASVTPEGPSSATSTDIDGTRVTKVGNVEISYDDKGRPYLFKQSGSSRNEVEIDYNEGEINFYENNKLSQTVGVSFNGSGFISRLTLSYDLEYSDYSESASGDMKFSYDGDGHLTKVKEQASGKVTDYEEDETYNYTYDHTSNLTWTKGNLVEIESEEIERVNGYEVESDENVTTFDYSRDLNQFKQFPMSLCYDHMDNLDLFFVVGLFGNGPADLPSYLEHKEDGRIKHSYNISFNLNNNGSFSTERMGNSRTWTYDYSRITRSCGNEGSEVKLPTIFGKLKTFRAKK
ncbi:MAG: DUF4595 domain-containing protein [Muribaculaceae bacterium]|nr:DUF4595 domain-containing protein [Muribaculaceae bacterium]